MSRFWIFMLIVDMLVPITMLCFGLHFLRCRHKSRHGSAGYRSTYALKSEESWKFAQKHAGRTWLFVAGAEFILSLLILFLLRGSKNGLIGGVGAGLVVLQLGAMFLSILPTERALRKNFGKKAGRRKKK